MKKIVFLTGTRADFGKIKPLIKRIETEEAFEPYIFVTGMHMQLTYGYTVNEVKKAGFQHIYTFENHTHETTMDLTLAKTIEGFSAYINELSPNLIVVHGDRVEALAGAIVGSLNNILVAHIEGGELSGTIDELIRHSVSKLSHIHFVSNEEAAKRLEQMGEYPKSIFVIGSPDIDVMNSATLPTLEEVKKYYEIPFDSYAIVLFHPVTTEVTSIATQADALVNALLESKQQYVVIYPNNDMGSSSILESYTPLHTHSNFRCIPSLRFEYFLTLLKHANFMIGNSSAGVREAPHYGIPSITIGTRQQARVPKGITQTVTPITEAILEAIQQIGTKKILKVSSFGNGSSATNFLTALQEKTLWDINHQKQFNDI